MTTEQKTRRWTMADIRRESLKGDRYFFARDTMRHWGSRIEGGPYQGPGGVFFVTSERGAHNDSPRRFTVREWRAEKCRIHTLGEFQGFRTREDARQAAKDAANGR